MSAMMNATKIILSEIRCRFEAIYGERLTKLVLFGSHARGEAEVGSDIDVMVVLKGPVNPSEEIKRTSAAKAALSLKHNVSISCTFMSEERYNTEKSPLLLNVRREGIAA